MRDDLAVRTDVHRPSTIVAGDYRYVETLDLNLPQELGSVVAEMSREEAAAAREALREQERRVAAYGQRLVGDHRTLNRCSVCGHPGLQYVVIWEHTLTGGLIVTGDDCAASIDAALAASVTRAAGLLRTRAAELRELHLISTRREQWIASHPDRAEVAATLGRIPEGADDFADSLRRQLRRKGCLSDFQVAAALNLETRIAARAVRMAERETQILTSRHVGTIGQRATFTLTLVGKPCVIAGRYDIAWGHPLRDSAGNLMIWYASGTSPWETPEGDYAVGETHTVVATVKRHDMTRDGAQRTVLTRLTPVEKRR
jgi:hypothetical protein